MTMSTMLLEVENPRGTITRVPCGFDDRTNRLAIDWSRERWEVEVDQVEVDAVERTMTMYREDVGVDASHWMDPSSVVLVALDELQIDTESM